MKFNDIHLSGELPTAPYMVESLAERAFALSALSLADDASFDEFRSALQQAVVALGGSVRPNPLKINGTEITCSVSEDNIIAGRNFLVFVQDPLNVGKGGSVLWK